MESIDREELLLAMRNLVLSYGSGWQRRDSEVEKKIDEEGILAILHLARDLNLYEELRRRVYLPPGMEDRFRGTTP
jgi:hypothetical protein